LVFTRKTREPIWLMRHPEGRVLAVTESGDIYYLVDEITGQRERIDLQRAVQLWQQGKREGWERLDRSSPNISSEDVHWPNRLRLKLGFPDDE
jgi:hypothetical protein